MAEKTERRTAWPREGPAALVVFGVLFCASVLAIAVLVWQVSSALLLVFAAVVIARIFGAFARLIEENTPAGPKLALASSVGMIFIFLGAVAFLAGSRVRSDLATLAERLPRDLVRLGEQFGIHDPMERLSAAVQGSDLIWNIVGYTTNIANIATGLLVTLIAGIYLAANPALYRNGVLALMPRRVRPRIAHAMDTAGHALELWLLGKLMMMAIVFAATTSGLYLIGVPSALTLGILAGLLEFIPFVGPIIGAVPALLIALSEGGAMIYWVAGLYILVQQIENNLLIPLIQQRTVQLPPVLSLFAILAFGMMFGAGGLLLAMPLTVVIYVFVKQLYIRDFLHEQTEIPGEREPEPD